MEYDESGKPLRIDAVVISTQHADTVTTEQLRADILKYVIQATLPSSLLDENTKYHINPTGRFVVGGPMGDTGLTGRKIIVDTYGGMGRHGGGAFSGKDATKVDRSAAYMARYIAKNIVAAGLADRAEVQLAYAIGVAEPVSVLVETFGTGKVDREILGDLVRKNFALTPKGIIESLNLRRPIFQKTAAYGHFGRNDADFTWEKTDKAEALREGAKAAQACRSKVVWSVSQKRGRRCCGALLLFPSLQSRPALTLTLRQLCPTRPSPLASFRGSQLPLFHDLLGAIQRVLNVVADVLRSNLLHEDALVDHRAMGVLWLRIKADGGPKPSGGRQVFNRAQARWSQSRSCRASAERRSAARLSMR